MAARRAAAKAAAAAAAAEPPPPPAEPTPEPEPETKDLEPADKPPKTEDNPSKSKSKDSMQKKEGKVTERVIERIIICPGGQNPYMPAPPGPTLSNYPPQGQGQCLCNPSTTVSKNKKKRNKRVADEQLCNHPYCIVQRAKVRPQGLPWASGLWPGPNPSPKPPVVICQRPVLYCCSHDRNDSEDSSCDEEDSTKTDTETTMTFMNMVFAAANVMNERRDVF